MGIVEIKNLTYTYPSAKIPALKDVNIEIEKGEFILLTGPSGCGKTTFCRCLNGLIPHFYTGEMTGDTIVNGLNTRNHPTYELAKHVGLIFQNPDNQIFALTVEKDIAFGLENLGLQKEKIKAEIDWSLAKVESNHLKERGTHELSGGQKQRVTIASILAMHPSLIVMDEPTAFLDPVGAEKIFRVLDMLNKQQGITIILIEHRMDLAVKYCSRIVIFNRGSILSDGSPRQVFALDETRLIGVGIPRMIELSRKLKQENIDINVPLSADEAFKRISPLMKKGILKKEKNQNGWDQFTSEHLHSPVIQVEDVHFSYSSNVHALNGISLKINKGEYVAIMGENGAGKTTLVKHFNGLLRPNKGVIKVDGENIAKKSVANLAKKVGLVFQNPDDQLFAEDVEEEISFALKNFGYSQEIIKKRVDWALNLLDIERYRNTSPFILSGGERKRVALASVLTWDPDVLVLDEPTIGQDYGQKERLRHFLLQLRTQGKTVVIVTHDVEFVAESQPRIILMAHGNVIADGSTKEVMTNQKALETCSVAPPEITRLFYQLGDYSLPKDVLDVDEGAGIIYRRIKNEPS